MPSTSSESRRFVTPTLIIDETANLKVTISEVGVFTVNSEAIARLILSSRGLSGCCIEDRLSVARGGDTSCDH